MFSDLLSFPCKETGLFRVCKFLFLSLFFLFSATSLFGGAAYGWHDQQRIAQLVVLLVAALFVFVVRLRSFPICAMLAVVVIFGLGLLSSYYSEFPGWALKEWARYLALIFLVMVVGNFAAQKNFRMTITVCMTLVAAIQVFQFLVLYFSAFVSGLKLLHASVLLHGFSNPRFFGQFQVLLLPVLAFLICYLLDHQRKKVAILVAVVLVLQWCISYMLGGRGLWLAALLSHAALVLFAKRFWRLVAIQMLSAFGGLVLFVILFDFIPYWFDLTPALYDGLRTDLSKREIIWYLAWNMAATHPWLGMGPMHFSAIYNVIAAHPHQVVLQWLAEWGAPATILAILLIVWGMLAGVRFLRNANSEYEDAGLWVALLASLLLAQVDGVFVMPYVETWLAVLAGIALSRWSGYVVINLRFRFLIALLSVPVVVVLGLILFSEVMTLPGAERAYPEHNSVSLSPRFWEQGWIR